ncbi:MAG: DivIVA domain-containing protein [Oscillospiraceae bacterium]|nr:DivIVA domain-containing protein [Oscillospiraceae bacterium]
MTPQDIREKVLEKTVIGGYDIAAVDQFREEAAVALAEGQKETAVLKGKMKVLVDKIEDYRATEDAMRLALVQAQKVAKQITEDAKTQAAQTIAEAEAYAAKVRAEADVYSRQTIGGLQQAKADEEERLLLAKAASAKFMQDARALCVEQLNYLDTMSAASGKSAKAPAVEKPAPVEEPVVETPAEEAPVNAADVQETIRSIDSSVAISAEEEPEIDITPVIEAATPAVEPDEATQLYRFLQSNS